MNDSDLEYYCNNDCENRFECKKICNLWFDLDEEEEENFVTDDIMEIL